MFTYHDYVGWQVTLCYLMWQVTLRSSEMGFNPVSHLALHTGQ